MKEVPESIKTSSDSGGKTESDILITSPKMLCQLLTRSQALLIHSHKTDHILWVGGLPTRHLQNIPLSPLQRRLRAPMRNSRIMKMMWTLPKGMKFC